MCSHRELPGHQRGPQGTCSSCVSRLCPAISAKQGNHAGRGGCGNKEEAGAAQPSGAEAPTRQRSRGAASKRPHRHGRVGWIQCQAASSSLWETSPHSQEGCDPKTTESCQDFGNADGMKGTKSKPGIIATNQEPNISHTLQTPLCAPWKAPHSPQACEPLPRCLQQACQACAYGESSPSPAWPVKPHQPDLSKHCPAFHTHPSRHKQDCMNCSLSQRQDNRFL